MAHRLTLTARQYGEVVLPDEAPGPPIFSHNCHGARRVWRTFCRHGTNSIEYYACRGTSMTGAGKLSRYRILVGGTGAVSRYKVDRSQKTVKVYLSIIASTCACSGARPITNLPLVQ